MQKPETLEWQTIEHVYYEKTADWYWIVGIIGGTIGLLSIIFSNAVFGLLILIATSTVLLHAARRPGISKIILGKTGVRVGSDFYAYQNLKSFSISDDQSPSVLCLDTRALLVPDVRVFIEGSVTPDMVKDFLLDHLDEKYHQPSLAEGLIHYFGF